MTQLGKEIHYIIRSEQKKEALCVGAKVVLERNLWFDGRLLNGSRGEILEIKYHNPNPAEYELPKYVLVRFEEYAGKELYTSEDMEGVQGVPIVPILDELDELEGPMDSPITKKNLMCIPLRAAYGVTVHKTQSLTLPRVAVFLSWSEIFTGMDFVSMSRVRSLNDLAILDSHIQHNRFVQSAATTQNRNFFHYQLREQERLELRSKFR